MNISVDLLRSLFRHLIEWRSLYESDGVDIIYGPGADGKSTGYAIQDVEFLYDLSQRILSHRQKQAIRLCLLNNLTEEETARIMKIDEANPVAMYATSGLETIVSMCKVDILPSRQVFYARQSKYLTDMDWNKTFDRMASDPRIAFFEPEVFSPDMFDELTPRIPIELPVKSTVESGSSDIRRVA